MAVNLKALAQLLATIPDDGVESKDRALYQEAVAAEVTELATLGAKLALAPADVKERLGIQGVEKTEDDHAADGLAFHKFNVARARVPGAPFDRARQVARIDLLNAAPELLTVEADWRKQAAGDAKLATALGYWDKAEAVDLNTPAWQTILDAVEAAVPGLGAIRAALCAVCVETVPGPASSMLDDAGLSDATIDDVRQALGAI